MNGAASFWKHKGTHGGFNQRRLEGDEAAAEEAGGGEASWSYSRAATSSRSRSRRRSRRRRRWWNRGGGSCSTRLMRARELKQDVTISHRVCDLSARAASLSEAVPVGGAQAQITTAIRFWECSARSTFFVFFPLTPPPLRVTQTPLFLLSQLPYAFSVFFAEVRLLGGANEAEASVF
jgi:hypothetical protein